MTTKTREQEHQEELQRHFQRESETATELWQLIQDEPVELEDIDEEYQAFFEENKGHFDVITWINYECLEANSHDLLLATGGPAYGVTNIHGRSPTFWYQNWFTEKFCKQFQGHAFDFYAHIFERLEEY